MNSHFEITNADAQEGSMRVYQYGLRLDTECVAAADAQVHMARLLYNNIIAEMRTLWESMQAWTLSVAGPEGAAAQDRVAALNTAFDAARAANNEDQMKLVAAERRAAWAELGTILTAVRKKHA